MKIYKVFRLKNCIIVVRKYYPVCLSQFRGMIIKNFGLYRQYIQMMVEALEKLLQGLTEAKIKHGNIKLTNCFVRVVSSHTGPVLRLIVSDPHMKMMFDKPKNDSEGVADIMHSLISGRMPVIMPEADRMLHQAVLNSGHARLIQLLYENRAPKP